MCSLGAGRCAVLEHNVLTTLQVLKGEHAEAGVEAALCARAQPLYRSRVMYSPPQSRMQPGCERRTPLTNAQR